MFNPSEPHTLKKLPPGFTLQEHPNLMAFLTLHNNALQAISELNGALREIESPEIFLNTFYLKESISSSAVENIHTTIESALEDETKPDEERKKENKEVLNYRKALMAGVESAEKYGLASRTIKEIHRELNVKKGWPGEYRRIQNSIANRKRDGSVEILYTPPVAPQVEDLIGNWERFAANDNVFFPLIKAAICHYQFEAIHPFEDGNGRTGRIMMVLQLMQDELLAYPAFFISSYLSEHDESYKERLLNVTRNNDWWGFIEFILEGFQMQALKTRIAILNLKKARKELRDFLFKSEKKPIQQRSVRLVVDHIFQYPTTHPKFMERQTGIHWQTCSKYLKALKAVGVLKEHPQGKYKFFRNQRALDAMVAKK
jgi:Fic family protein